MSPDPLADLIDLVKRLMEKLEEVEQRLSALENERSPYRGRISGISAARANRGL